MQRTRRTLLRTTGVAPGGVGLAGCGAQSVTAVGDGDGTTHWAPGGFSSEESARTGWENGTGAVASGMEGSVIVEE